MIDTYDRYLGCVPNYIIDFTFFVLVVRTAAKVRTVAHSMLTIGTYSTGDVTEQHTSSHPSTSTGSVVSPAAEYCGAEEPIPCWLAECERLSGLAALQTCPPPP